MKSKYIKFVFLLFFILVFFPIVSVKASYIPNHAYAQQHNSLTNYGGYFYNPYGQSSLISNFDSLNNYAFITNEMWTAFGDSSQWIEVGDVDGNLNGNYWAGHFTAVQPQDPNKYQEYSIGSNYASSGHSFEIQYLGSFWWGVYVDYQLAIKFYMPFDYSTFTQVGIETNNTAATFSNGIYNANMQYKDLSGTWHNWYSSLNYDINNLNWTSNYLPNLNRIVYNHN
ncbi:hypothetical protein M2651_09330 [Clostridium sp. SYSU_GA19001]|uniref:hypothetical protein n=1 Tax=Clostridium caldaquaticum TaxID=2940653 RepID=UPI0020776EB1|nr:hypothetical protein [Clostridium caldaquaticum]MCM8711230.1 hypothetical protein [Clostridium caldaquaticum]